MSEPVEITVLDRHWIDRERGLVMMLVAPAPFQMSRDSPEIIGMTVRERLNGRIFRVVGVDCFKPATPISAGEHISLAVEPLDD